ncbi:hypothetical protein [Sutcliffiella cohnii]|uniref:hypothetical protein n=1 Tax=Sutcliffiella cohnii TaxID=33932 RepID=UPI000A9065DA|nr:hypothetical protein [Sutcliffiella cohnii]
MISISGLLSIVFIIIYFLLDWYFQELHQEQSALKKTEAPTTKEYRIKENPDGTHDYSELYADYLEDKRKAKRATVEMSNIEGTETELLLSSLQQELEQEDIQPNVDIDKKRAQVEENCVINIDHVHELPISDASTEQHQQEGNEQIDVYEKICELRDRLKDYSKDEADMVDIEEMVMTQYQLFKLEGRYDQVQQIEKDFHMYFPHKSNPGNTPRFFEEDILSIEDMDSKPVNIAPPVHKHATCSIADEFYGEQRWRGKVIGKAKDYIHFTDYSRRIWIHAGGKISKISLGDELILSVDRSEEEVRLKQMLKVKPKSSQPHLNIVNQ